MGNVQGLGGDVWQEVMHSNLNGAPVQFLAVQLQGILDSFCFKKLYVTKTSWLVGNGVDHDRTPLNSTARGEKIL